MNKAVKKLWVEALRSGDFEQGSRVLRGNDNKCSCLGVLCELAYEAGVISKPKLVKLTPILAAYLTGDVCPYGYGKPGFVSYPPAEVTEWADLPYSAVGALSILTNDYGMPFAVIADYIERVL